jgi:hypothetical protein
LIAGVSLIASLGIAKADDHLFQALQGGLTLNRKPFVTNPAGHSGTLANGQGSPFTGHDTQTPSTNQVIATAHANVKQRVP